jgi:hypothetical protein
MEQLTVVRTHSEHWSQVLQTDPVRPGITHWQRIAANRECFVLHEEISVKAVLCAAYLGAVPKTEADVLGEWSSFNVACFYSVWSFQKGSGRKIITQALTHIKCNKPYVTRAVTLSPKTAMARDFHLSNGAKLLQENERTVNFEYGI